MGTVSVEYKAICDTCKQYLDLNKLDMWCAKYEQVEEEDADDLHERGVFIPMCCRLLKFLTEHNGHSIRLENLDMPYDNLEERLIRTMDPTLYKTLHDNFDFGD